MDQIIAFLRQANDDELAAFANSITDNVANEAEQGFVEVVQKMTSTVEYARRNNLHGNWCAAQAALFGALPRARQQRRVGLAR